MSDTVTITLSREHADAILSVVWLDGSTVEALGNLIDQLTAALKKTGE